MRGDTIEENKLVDLVSESGVISTLIYHPNFYFQTPYLKERYFFDAENSCFFWAIKWLITEKKVFNIDASNIEIALKSDPRVYKRVKESNISSLEEYIDLCSESKTDTVEEFKIRVDRVVSLAFRREFKKSLKSFESMCNDLNNPIDQLNSGVYRTLNDLTAKFVTNGEIKSFGDKVDNIWNGILEKKNRGETYGIPSAFDAVNDFFQYEKKELIVIAARMKEGKSILAMTEALDKAMNGVCTFVQDSEMSDELWYIRALSYLTGIDTSRIKNAKLSGNELDAINKANRTLKKIPLFHNYDPYMTKEKFYSICAQKKVEDNLEFVIWDYIKCSDDITVSSERSAYMGGITNWLKNVIAGDLDLAVLAFAQLNRGGEVAESDGIEKFCSTSVRWERKTDEEMAADGNKCGTHKLIVRLNRIGKQHMGSDDYIDMKFKGGGYLGIVQADQHEEKNPFDSE